MSESWEEWAKRQPKEFQDARAIVDSYQRRRGDESRAEEMKLARSMVGSYWTLPYGHKFIKILKVDGIRIEALEVDIGEEYSSVKIQKSDNPYLARQENWKDKKLSPMRITKEQFYIGIRPLLNQLRESQP